MAGRGERLCEAYTILLTNSLSTTPEISISRFAAGTIYIPAESSITTLTFYAAFTTQSPGGVYMPAYDNTGTAITMTVAAGGAYQMPAGIFGAGQIKIVANEAGGIEMSLKS